MGVVNVTPDSFSDGGRHPDSASAVANALRLAEDGADILDVGGESTRPGASPVPEEEELRRVIPVVEVLARRGLSVSVDTRKPRVMREALAAGAAMINDVGALRAPGALETVATSEAAVCLMHMRGEPGTMQAAPAYGDVVAEVRSFLLARAQACRAAGMTGDRIVLDPGFGFGKLLEHNLALLRGLGAFVASGYPVLVGLSRKSMLGTLTGRCTGERLAASIAAAVVCAERGAAIVRVHDVRETLDALRVWEAA
jgi:dihydropteroate synthase